MTSFAQSGYPTVRKDPDAVLDYHVVWADWLGTDTIASSTWDVQAGLTLDSSAVNVGSVTIDGTSYAANTVTTAWLSGGTASTRYSVRNRITTTGGRTEDRTFYVYVTER